ncbi:exosortase A [Noviherbaspirillum sedimenti]|uniref:Exosortase A n=1 Tax=Noviherbaspirillum sedimenti TaxID=2320865 RepID=A0A3A3G0B9_9BURK|nr:exosortase A [Noviherbaspirillum sedimenti]RJG01887.1 exosortase A [Noviherbaspirillum sedimenti]
MISQSDARSRFWILCAVGATLLAPFIIYFATARSIVAIWNSSETFAHGYIILPISLWLVWRERGKLARLTPAPWWPALLLLAACGFGWLLAYLGDVQVLRQYAFVAMIPAAAVAVLGWRISSRLAFPLLFLLFAVPFGDIFIDPLIRLTADFTVAAVEATGIPILRQGNNFSLPSGDWSVVEACSGVRYLISSVTLGCLYAYLTYRSWQRRLLFVLVSIVVPIVANGARAFMIVMIGHFSGMQLAVGVDHLVYGWLFFGLVMFLMFWIGSFWREDAPRANNPAPTDALLQETTPPDVPASPAASTAGGRMAAAAIAAIAAMALWPAYGYYLEHSGAPLAQADLSGFRPGWQAGARFTDWKPHFQTPNAEISRFFRKNAQQAGLTLLYYRNQHDDSELINSQNRLVVDEDPSWRRISSRGHQTALAGQQLAVRETQLQGASGKLLVWQWYWIDGGFLLSDYTGKLLQAKLKLLRQRDDGASLMAYAPLTEDIEQARATLRDFLAENLAPLEAMLAANRQSLP